MNKKDVVYIFLLVLSASFLLFWQLGNASLVNWDEGIYAITEYEFVSNPTLVPHLFGDPWIEKVPAGYWLNSIGVAFFGLNEFGIRVAGSLVMLMSAVLLFWIGKRLSSSFWGWIAAMLYIASPLLYYGSHFVREGDLEPYYVFFLLLSIYWYIRSWDKPWYIVATAIALGCGFMTRGFSFALVAVAFIADMLVFQRTYTWRQLLAAVGAGVAVVAPWHIAAYLYYPAEFILVYFQEQFASRIVDPLHNHAGSVWFYGEYIWNVSKLAFIALIGSLLGLVTTVYRIKDRFAWFLLIMLIVLMLPIHVMATKLHWYLVPIIPLIYLALGCLAHQAVQRLSIRGKQLVQGAGVFLVIVCLALSSIAVLQSKSASSVELVNDILRQQQASNVVVYEVELWQQGRVMPAAYVYWQLMADKTLFPITESNLNHYLARPDEYHIFISATSAVQDIVGRFPDSQWQAFSANAYTVLVR